MCLRFFNGLGAVLVELASALEEVGDAVCHEAGEEDEHRVLLATG